MPSKIRVLDEHTINKIAAGEVIENPSSVIKELVENSIDAGSTEIIVEITGGGRQMIRITDNGCGMNNDDAVLCLERHATSKIRSVEEIFQVETMGFRGEAVPSIAAISKFMLLTATEDSQGTLVLVEGGKVLKCAPAVRSRGTTIEVKSLFYNIPVRMKFQKSPAYDANEIYKVMMLLALGHGEVSFKFISNGKILLQTSQKGLQERAKEVLGEDFVKYACLVEEEKDGVLLRGLVSLPSHTRHNRSGQYLFINKRAVQSAVISFAVKEGYGTALSTGRYPLYLLHLDLPGNLVDVNVHPQKKEVRLRQELAMRDLVSKAIAKSLRTINGNLAEVSEFYPQEPLSEPKEEQSTYAPLSQEPIIAKSWNWGCRPNFDPPEEKVNQEWVFEPKIRTEPPKPLPEAKSLIPASDRGIKPKALATITRYIILDEASISDTIKERLQCHSRGGMFLLDQKSAHVRVIFENLVNRSSRLSVQNLLIPHTIDLAYEEAALLRDQLGDLANVGVVITELHPNKFIVKAIPQLFGNTDIEALISTFIKEETREGALHSEREKRLALAASHAAISYNNRLSLFEGQTLINQLMECQQPYYCPMGKEIFHFISHEELAKQLKK